MADPFSGLLFAAAIGVAARAEAPEPVVLDVSRAGGSLAIRVVAQGSRPIDLGYELVVEGASRVVQRGRVPAGEAVAVLCSVRIADEAGWRAQLDVSGADTRYTIARASTD
jgi:hypothetical protein